MKKSLVTRIVAVGAVASLAAAVAASPAGAVQPAADPGVSSNQIVIGNTSPLTGAAAPGYKDMAALKATKSAEDYWAKTPLPAK